MVIDPFREDKEEQFGIKKNSKKRRKKLRHGGATADHCTGEPQSAAPSSSPIIIFREKEESLCLERERRVRYDSKNRTHAFIGPLEPF